MSSSGVAIQVDGLGKEYSIRHNATDHITLAESVISRIRHPLRRPDVENFWALRGVSFEVASGEVVGVVGRNGAGKSTLLKLLTQITAPTEGLINLWGRVGSLLEVGTGFHPELTGRENVYLNGAVLGMSKRDIDRQFDSIVDFAGVEKFLDTPVKRFSSGMYIRLGFAIAAHLETEVLLLDEILAVGDSEFQQKCFTKVVDLAQEGRAVLLVSHNLAAIEQFTTRTIWLSSGKVAAMGPTRDVVRQYGAVQASSNVNVEEMARPDPAWGKDVRILGLSLESRTNTYSADDDISFRMTVRSNSDLSARCVSVKIRSVGGATVGTGFSPKSVNLPKDRVRTLAVTLPSPSLAPGEYLLSIAIGSGDRFADSGYDDGISDALVVDIEATADADRGVPRWDTSWGYTRYSPIRVEESRNGDVGPSGSVDGPALESTR